MTVAFHFNKLKYRCAIPYMDDVLILSQTVNDHFKDLKDVLDSLRRGGLKLKKSKCEYFMDKIDFLGMIVTQKGIQPCPKKIEELKSLPRPKNVHEVRSFTGLCQFLKNFIKDFSKIIRPMYRLTEKGSKFEWTPECQTAFDTMKSAICEKALLHYPDFNKEFILATGASCVGAALSQEDDTGVLRPVAFAGRCLRKHEKNYNTTERELLGVVYAVQHFRHYLENRHFKLYTDHADNTQAIHREQYWR